MSLNDPGSDHIRYAQVWEDADILLAALKPAAGSTLASIASAGDNVLALLTTDPARVVAIDLSAAQLACLRLRIAAYRILDHGALLELMGSRDSSRREEFLDGVLTGVDRPTREFWLARKDAVIEHGIGGIGKFERYFRVFRTAVLPLVHGHRTIQELLTPKDAAAREEFYRRRWNSPRWRLMLNLFFSKWTMGRLGRDPSFFAHAQGSLSAQVARRARYALTVLDPAENPYLHWILTGRHGEALPLALRPEHFETIRSRLDRIEFHHGALESYPAPAASIDGWNLSDVFEYMTPSVQHQVYARLLDRTRIGGRLVYWNMMAPRRAPEALAGRVQAHTALAAELGEADKAFFYSALVVEERRA